MLSQWKCWVPLKASEEQLTAMKKAKQGAKSTRTSDGVFQPGCELLTTTTQSRARVPLLPLSARQDMALQNRQCVRNNHCEPQLGGTEHFPHPALAELDRVRGIFHFPALFLLQKTQLLSIFLDWPIPACTKSMKGNRK